MTDENSEIPKDRITAYLNGERLFLNEKGEPFFNRTLTVEKWNSYLKLYEKHPELTRVEPVTVETLGYKKHADYNIFIYKVEKDELEDETVYYSMTLSFDIPEEARYRYFYFKKVRSGKIMLCQLDSGCVSEASVNGEFVSRGKAKKLPPDTMLKLDSPIFTIENGELTRRVEVNTIYG